MLSRAKFSTLRFIVCLAIVTTPALAVQIDLPQDTILLEADAGKMDKGVEIVDDKGASEGKATNHERGVKTVHEIDLPKAGDWYLWIRILCPNADQDSYWVGMDKATPEPPEDALGEQGVRIYSAVGDSVNTNDQPFNIWFWDFGKANTDPHSLFDVKTAGKYTFWTKGREVGTLIDQILLTTDEDFNPEEESRGEWIDIAQSVQPNAKLAVTWGNLKQ